ncbi:MAG: histidinol-phosphatase [Clostridiaceae bacterium]|nr:histidinol-phosphatase [Clostridiaceae bacterium]
MDKDFTSANLFNTGSNKDGASNSISNNNVNSNSNINSNGNNNSDNNCTMYWANLHTHCSLCDGKGEPVDYVHEAIKSRVKILGFSCHASLPFYTGWTMTGEKQKEYLEVVSNLKKHYEKTGSDGIRIKLGLEIDYIPGISGSNMRECKGKMQIDYSIGSVHFIGGYSPGRLVPVDSQEEDLLRGIKTYFGNNTRKAVEEYYMVLQEMIGIGGFDILGHLDLIKKNNKGSLLFSEGEKWYRDIVDNTLSLISRSGLILEVNTGGMARKYFDTTYPSPWILEKCLKLNIPIVLSSDAHQPSHVAAFFPETAKMLKYIGFKELFTLGEKGWEPCRFTPGGICL